MRDTHNSDDMHFAGVGDQLMLKLDKSAKGYSGQFNIGLDLANAETGKPDGFGNEGRRRGEVTMKTLATIGYQSTTVRNFLEALKGAHIKLLVDVRAVAMSRRPGFAKTALAANLHEAGIDYLHLRRLGTPADGRAAARAGKHEVMREIFLAHLATDGAQEELHALADLVKGNRNIAIMCFEAEPKYCHRTMVAGALKQLVPITVSDLMPDIGESD